MFKILKNSILFINRIKQPAQNAVSRDDFVE